MSRDVFVYWDQNKPIPSRVQLRKVLEDYLGALAVRVTWERGRYFIELPGEPSFALQRMPGITRNTKRAWKEMAKEDDGTRRPRFFEVYVGQTYIDIITREADEVTNHIAKGYAELCARFWEGRIDRG